MTNEQYLKNLSVPNGMIDVILDTDTYNEIDDQFALAYMLASDEKFNVKGITAAPFYNDKSSGPADGMEKSYHEILKLLKLMNKEELESIVYRGSERYLPDENTYVDSPAADFIAELAVKYTPEKPLYIIAIGAVTNVASAIIKCPSVKENCVIVWLGGNEPHLKNPVNEFNMMQDIAAARIVYGCGVPLVFLPCGGIVDRFTSTKDELEARLCGKNPISDYLASNTIEYMEEHGAAPGWTKVIWDVTAIGWLLNDGDRFMTQKLIHCPIPEYDRSFSFSDDRHLITQVDFIRRDELFDDLCRRLTEKF